MLSVILHIVSITVAGHTKTLLPLIMDLGFFSVFHTENGGRLKLYFTVFYILL